MPSDAVAGKRGQRIADGAVSEDGLVSGTYLHGLFDSNDFTRTLINALRAQRLAAAG
jgi:adenosylcobyric acid synthase